MIDINSLPRLPIPERHNLPEIGAVYFVLNETKEVEYIGVATNLRVRWKFHTIGLELDSPKKCFVAWLEIPNRDERLVLEREYISLFCPRININFNYKVQKNKRKRKSRAHSFSYDSHNDDLIPFLIAANLTGKTKSAISKLVARGKLKTVKIGRVNFISKSALLSLKYKRGKPLCPNS